MEIFGEHVDHAYLVQWPFWGRGERGILLIESLYCIHRIWPYFMLVKLLI